jgi:hypothetical protein
MPGCQKKNGPNKWLEREAKIVKKEVITMLKENKSKVSIAAAFKEAWKGFKGWWIPLCIASAILLFSQSWLPKYIWRQIPELKIFAEYKQEWKNYNLLLDAKYPPVAARKFFLERVKRISVRPATKQAFQRIALKLFLFFGGVILLVSVLNVIIILMARFAVSGKKENFKAHAAKPLTLSPSYLLLTIVKLAAFCFFIIPGIFIYVKLYFTGFIITEKSADPFSAMAESWKLTKGIFWPTLVIFLITLLIDLLSIVTVIGFIPGNSFKYTLRASLYKQVGGFL